MDDYDPDLATAFNEGCDARLQGVPFSVCPYPSEFNHLRYQWRRGWKHVELFWGMDAKWYVQSLQKVIA